MGREPHLWSNSKKVDNNFSSKKLFFVLNVLRSVGNPITLHTMSSQRKVTLITQGSIGHPGAALMNSSFIISKKDAIDGNESLLLELCAHLSENVGVALKNREHPERIPKDL